MAQPASIQQFWERSGLTDFILGTLREDGFTLDALTIDDLAPFDQFHGGGKAATTRLATLAGLGRGMKVLDVGGGLGGPARTLAAEYGCQVTTIDLTLSYVETANLLTQQLGLEHIVCHHLGDALELPYEDGSFDVLWTQNSGMNIAHKTRLYQEFHRVLGPQGIVALQEPMAGPVWPLVYPVMWADSPEQSFLLSPDELQGVARLAGFEARAWHDVTEEIAKSTPRVDPSRTIQKFVKGDQLDAITEASRQNRLEGRCVMVQAVLQKN